MATAACSAPATRRYIGTAIRRSTFTLVPAPLLAVTSIDAMTPPTWSPGVAVDGMASVNGSLTRLPGAIVTLAFGNDTQDPMSLGFAAAGSRSSEPDAVLNASEA